MNSVYNKIPSEFKLIVGLFLIIFGLTYLIGQSETEQENIRYFSSYEYGMYGTSSLYELADKIGFNIERHTRSFSSEISDEIGMIIILSPEVTFNITEIDNITNWISNGGILVYCSDIVEFFDLRQKYSFRQTVSFPVRDIMFPPLISEALQIDEPYTKFKSSDNQSEIYMSNIDDFSGSSLFNDINEIHAPLVYSKRLMHRLYFSFTQDTESDDESKSSDETSYYSPFDDYWQVLANDQGKPSIIMLEYSLGKVIGISNPMILSNGFIRAGDNIVFARNLLQLSKVDSKILIDEFRHGVDLEDFPSITQTGWGRTLYFLFFVGIIAIYSKSIRFIPPKIIPPPQRRSQVEYLRSMAQIIRRAKALNLIAQILLRETRNLPYNCKDSMKLRSELNTIVNSKRITITSLMEIYDRLHEIEKRDEIKSKKK